MSHPEAHCFLVADIGGTNTRIALSDGASLRQDTIRRYPNDGFDGFYAILSDYLAENASVSAHALCVAIAGPVRDGQGHLTNRDWTVDAAQLVQMSGLSRVALLNDLQAQGYALAHITPDDLTTVRQGDRSHTGAARLAVNLGTGFNASPVFETSAGPYVATSESGHASMPRRTERDAALCAFVEAKRGFVGIDDILSGRGLETIYEFVSEEAGSPRRASSDAIIAGCTSGNDTVAVESVAYFIRLAGLTIGNLALVQLPFGGIYLVGGLAAAIAPFMERAGFEDAFVDKGRFADFMNQFSIDIVKDDYAGLKGMAVYLENQVSKKLF